MVVFKVMFHGFEFTCYWLSMRLRGSYTVLKFLCKHTTGVDKKTQMSWSNICTTFPSFTKPAFNTQFTLGDELEKQRGESPLKLTLQLYMDKARASSSLAGTKEGNLFIIQREKKRKQPNKRLRKDIMSLQ